MKKPSGLVNLGLILLTLLCLAFACNDGGESEPTGGNVSGLPAGKYACSTTVQIYAGQGGSGSYTYPIYNSSLQTRGEIDVKSNGSYLLDDGSRCRYSYDPLTKSISWQDCTFADASSGRLINDDKGNHVIQIGFNGDKDVWNCTKE